MPVSKPAVHLTTVVGGFIKILPFMIEHYRSLGVDSHLVNVHLSSENDPVRWRIEAVAQSISCPIASMTVGNWQSVFQPIYSASRKSRPNDWFILADQDELQCYPDDLFEILRWCDSKGYDFIRGAFVDRLAADGGLAEVRPDPPIWDQYPLGGLITLPVCAADPHKIVAAKGYVPIGHGQHQALGGRGCPIEELFVQVHHFKWTAGIYQHLKERVVLLKNGGHSHWIDSARVLAYLDANNGRFDVTSPALMMEKCGRHFSRWDFVQALASRADELLRAEGTRASS